MTRLTLRQLKALEKKLYGGRPEWRPYEHVSDADLLAVCSGQPLAPDAEARLDAAMHESLRGVHVSPALAALTDAQLLRAFDALRPTPVSSLPESL